MVLDQIIGAVVIIGTLAYICHRVVKKRREIRRTVEILGPKERRFCGDLMKVKVRRLRAARA